MQLAWRCNSAEAGLGARVRVSGHKVGPGDPLLSLCSSPFSPSQVPQCRGQLRMTGAQEGSEQGFLPQGL